MNQLLFKLTKPCKAVDKYEMCDSKGELIKDPAVGAVYINKSIFKGAEYIHLTGTPAK